MGTALFLSTKIYAYLSVGEPPFGYYADLGVNAIATAYIAHAMSTWRDFSDNVGWGSWGNFPNFLYNPTTTYFLLVPIELLIKNVWLTIKMAQTAEMFVSLLTAAYLYATIVRRDVWCLVAGCLYAFLPAIALMIFGNLDIGWVYALVPFAIASALNLVRRFGVSSLPLCGVVSSLSGFCFAPEYLILASMPIYAIAVAAAVKRVTFRAMALAFVGLVCLISLGAFVILATSGAQHLFTDPAARSTSLAAGSEIGFFSESWLALLHLIPQEFIISDFKQFNARQNLGVVWLATVPLWGLAIFSAAQSLRAPNRRLRRFVLFIVVVLLALAMGTTLPLGAEVWRALRIVPGLALLRTPDRFLFIPLLFLIIGATESLATIWRLQGWRVRAVAVIIAAASIALFLNLDFEQHWLTTESDTATREPNLRAVNSVVSSVGGRTISYAYIRDGSQFFNASYGVPNPTLWFFWDPTSHYYADGLGGSGIFGRADVRTVVSSPNWMSDSALLPQMAHIDGVFPGRAIYRGAEGLLVKRIPSRGMLTAASASCLSGGPGLLDWAASIEELQGLTFVRNPVACAGQTYLDYDPRDSLAPGPGVIASWTAKSLLPGARPLQDADYPFDVGRTFINDSWYRNSVDGDETSDATGATNVLRPTRIALDVPARRAHVKMRVLIRLASHTFATLTVQQGRGPTIAVPIGPAFGMRWISLPFEADGSAEPLTLAFHDFALDDAEPGTTWQGIALDRVAVTLAAIPDTVSAHRTDALLFSLRRLVTGTSALTATTSQLRKAPEDSTAHLKLVERVHVDSQEVGGRSGEVAQQGRGVLTYEWSGATGDYLVEARGSLSGPRTQLALVSGDRSSAAASGYRVDGLEQVRTSLTLRLRAGRRLSIILTSPDSLPGSLAVLSSVRVVRITHARANSVPGRWNDEFSERFTVPLKDTQGALASASSMSHVDLEDDGIRGDPGGSIAYRFIGKGFGNAGTLQIGANGSGAAVVHLVCGAKAATTVIQSGKSTVTIAGAGLHSCRTEIRWLTGGLAIDAVRFDLLRESLPNVSARVWLPRGSYAARIYRPAIEERRALLVLDGRATSGHVDIERTGFHSIVLKAIEPDDRILALIADGRPVLQKLPAVSASTYDWTLSLKHRGSVEVAWYPDGNWRLQSEPAGATLYTGVRCDLINTCFVDLKPGRYHLYHLWPAALRLGLFISALTLFIAVLPLLPRLAISRAAVRRLTGQFVKATR